MYTMLLAASSWPGSPLLQHRGNGLLEHEKDVDLDVETDGCNPERRSSGNEASTIDSRHPSQGGRKQSLGSHSRDPLACPSRPDPQQHLFTEPDDAVAVDSWHLRPMIPHADHFAFLPSHPSPGFTSASPLRMTPSFHSTSPSVQSAEATHWAAVDHFATWWLSGCPTMEETPYSSVSPRSALFTTHLVVGNSLTPISDSQSSSLVDHGVQASNFDAVR